MIETARLEYGENENVLNAHMEMCISILWSVKLTANNLITTNNETSSPCCLRKNHKSHKIMYLGHSPNPFIVLAMLTTAKYILFHNSYDPY